MKYLLMLLSFVAAIYFSFSGVNHLINWITSGIVSPDIHTIVIIVLWVFGFTTVLGIGVCAGLLLAAIIGVIFPEKSSSKKTIRRY